MCQWSVVCALAINTEATYTQIIINIEISFQHSVSSVCVVVTSENEEKK